MLDLSDTKKIAENVLQQLWIDKLNEVIASEFIVKKQNTTSEYQQHINDPFSMDFPSHYKCSNIAHQGMPIRAIRITGEEKIYCTDQTD